MHLTDRLLCPRCGPGFGLILLAERTQDGHVDAGRLGCPNCRDAYPIAEGVADLRPPPRGPLEGPAHVGAGPPAEAVEALLGGLSVPGWRLLAGGPPADVTALAHRFPDGQWVGVHHGGLPNLPPPGAGSHLVCGKTLPVLPGTFRSAVVFGGGAVPWSWTALRDCLLPGGRLLLWNPSLPDREALGRLGLTLLLDAPQACVAAVPGPPPRG